MKTKCLWLGVLLWQNAFLAAQVPQERLTTWQQSVRYNITAEIDTTDRTLSGQMQIFYRNESPDTLRKIYLQVPSNAFHGAENTAVKEMQRFSGGNIDFDEERGYKLTILSLQFLSIGERTSFPLQAYDFSDTILDLTLPYALLPGDTLRLGLQFRQDFSTPGERHNRMPADHLMWYPKVAVYDSKGWHPDPFHFMMQPTDIYSEFGDMDVTLVVPWNFIVVASGDVLQGDPGWRSVEIDTALEREAFKATHDSLKAELKRAGQQRGKRTVRFHAEHLQNFIWSASPDYVHFGSPASPELHLFYTSYGHMYWLKQILSKLRAALSFLEDQFEVRPCDKLFVVNASRRAFAVPRMALLQNAGEFELAYELSAMFIPGLVAHNGVEQPWLANGLQVYMGKAYSEKVFGKQGYNLGEAQQGMNWLERQYPLPSLDGLLRNLTHLYNSSGQNEPISKAIHHYSDPLSALFNVYAKSDLFYEMLRYVVGDSLFKAGLHELMRAYRYKHIYESDLQTVFERVSGQDLTWFFDQWLHRTPIIDYSKGKTRKYQKADKTWVTEIELKRNGDGRMPVDVQVDLGGGKAVRKRWDGKDKQKTLVIETAEKPKAVKVDPDDRIMDSNRLNNAKPRLEIRPDWPFLRLIHMPNDALLVLWRPLLDYNSHDRLRLGMRARSSYRAFFNNLTLEAAVGVASAEVDGKIAYSHPLNRKSLLNRYQLMVRKNEGRFEADGQLQFNGSEGLISKSGRNLRLGFNYSSLLNDSYTFRKVVSDTGTVRVDEWQDVNVLLAYAAGRINYSFGAFKTQGRLRAELALPAGDVEFSKISGRIQVEATALGVTFVSRGNLATSFGPDPLPLQDQFRAEGAAARERFENDIAKTGNSVAGFRRRYVQGGGFLRGYHGQPLPAERYTTLNLEWRTRDPALLGLRLFGFFDTGRIWTTRQRNSFVRSDAGLGLSFLGDTIELFGSNLSLLGDFGVRIYFPLWLSDPLPGEKEAQFRWLISVGTGL